MKTNLLLLSMIFIQLLNGLLFPKEARKEKDLNTPTTSVTESSILYQQEDVPAEPIDLGLSVLWASYNVGATYPEGYGGYYAWGEIEEKHYYEWTTYKHSEGTRKTCHKLGKEISGTENDVARVKWGGKWRMPTKEEVEELCKRCNYVWTKVNGVQGVRFIAKNGNSVFFPNCGYRHEDSLYDRDLYGCYWSGTAETRNKAGNAFILALVSRSKGWNPKPRPNGCSVRPVMDRE